MARAAGVGDGNIRESKCRELHQGCTRGTLSESAADRFLDGFSVPNDLALDDASAGRPLAQGEEPFRALFEERRPLYAECADARARDADGVVLAAGGVTLELLRRTADAGSGPVSLSEREFLLLQHFMRRHHEVCTREELLDDVWGYSFDPGTNVVDVYVGRLRAKLGSDVIETVRNVGYSFCAA